MAGENQLKDAKITLRLDVDKAFDAVKPGTPGGGTPGGAKPGGTPPTPGRDDKDTDAEEYDRVKKWRPKNRPSRPGLSVVGTGKRAQRAVVGVVKTLAAASALQIVADALPAMIAAKKDSLDADQVISKIVLSVIEDFFGAPAEGIAATLNAMQAFLPQAQAFLGTGMSVARSNLLGDDVGLDIIGEANIQRKVAAVRAAQSAAQRAIVPKETAKMITDSFDSADLGKMISDALTGNAATSK